VLVHLVDGTYELFRHYYGNKEGHRDADGTEVGAVRGVLTATVALLESGATHVGVATDHVIESFRNDLWPGYKTGDGIDPLLLAQFPLLEDVLASLGVAVWPMVDLEADDALATAALVAAGDERVVQVLVCTPDKDLGQCVGGKVVQLDQRNQRVLDADAVRAKFGVSPPSIPDYLALVGDSADGFPGLPGWGAKSAAAVLARWETVEAIPDDPSSWGVAVRGADKLAATLRAGRDLVTRFKVLATLRTDADVGTVDDWAWGGARDDLVDWCARLGSPRLAERAASLAARGTGAA
jgi:5'-3' exonuclease